MSCSCDAEMPEFFCESFPKAWKEHKCYECRDIIKIGEKYQRNTGKWNGDIQTFIVCMSCAELRSETDWSGGYLNSDEWCYPAFGELGCCYVEWLRESNPDGQIPSRFKKS